MTIVNNAAADGFIQRLPKEVCFYLVHGQDEGLAHERVKTIVRNLIGRDSDPMRLVRLDGDVVAREPGGLADEAYASKFAEQRRKEPAPDCNPCTSALRGESPRSNHRRSGFCDVVLYRASVAAILGAILVGNDLELLNRILVAKENQRSADRIVVVRLAVDFVVVVA